MTYENVEQLLKRLHAIRLKFIPSNRYVTVDSVVCSSRKPQIGCEFMFPNMQCISGECDDCGEKVLQDVIHSSNN